MAQELKSYTPTFGEKVKYTIQDLLMGLGAQSYPAGHIAGGIKDLLGFTPLAVPMGVSEMQHGMDAGSPVQMLIGAAGALPAGRLAAPVAGEVAAAAKPVFKDKTEEALHYIMEALNMTDEDIAKLSAQQLKTAAQPPVPQPPLPTAAKLDNPFVPPPAATAPTSFIPPKAEPIPKGVTSNDLDAAFKELEADLASLLQPTVAAKTHPGLPSVEQYKGYSIAPTYNEADGFIQWNVLGQDGKPISTHPWLDLAQEAVDDYAFAGVKAGKKAPVDQGITLEDWLAKNPGGTINDYLGVANAPTQPIKTATAAENTWDSPYIYTVPPRPATSPDTPVPGWAAALDAEEATRQANAIAGGYTTDAFHGTRGFEPYTPDPYATYPVPRGEMPIQGSEFYSTPSGDLAEMYANGLSTNPAKGYSSDYPGQIIPLKLNTQNYHVFDGKGGHWSSVNRQALREAREMGAPGVRIDNVWDEPMSTHNLPEPKTIFITLPDGANTVRSKYAKFDPEKFHINDILAGLAGAGIVGPGFFGGDNSK